MTPKEEIIKLIEDLPDDATLEEIMAELHVWTKPGASIPIVGREKTSSHRRRGKWLN